jgi:hypothetical protein
MSHSRSSSAEVDEAGNGAYATAGLCRMLDVDSGERPTSRHFGKSTKLKKEKKGLRFIGNSSPLHRVFIAPYYYRVQRTGIRRTTVREASALRALRGSSIAGLVSGIAGWKIKREIAMAIRRTDNAALFWNGVLLDAMRADSNKPAAQQEHGGPTRASRAAAIVHAAIHNAVNGVHQLNAFYQDPKTNQPERPGPPPQGAAQEPAGAGAAYRALVVLYPSQQATFDQARTDFQRLPLPGANHQPSFVFGEGVAQQLLDARANDGSDSTEPYEPPTEAPGVWKPDPNLAPPGPPLTPQWGKVRLFLLDDIARVRPPAFPALSSGDYAFAFRNVRDKGGAHPPPPDPPRGPTEDEKNIALFFSYDFNKFGWPIRLYNLHAFQILRQEPNVPLVGSVLHRHARMFALINLAMADAGIACWEAKFRPPGFRPPGSTSDPSYHIWRPFQGIPGAENDSNDETVPVPDWLPLGQPRATDAQGDPLSNTTPNFPAYPSGHSSFGAASYGMLRKFFGRKRFPFTLSSEEVSNRRSYDDIRDPQNPNETITSWARVINENDLSRIILGVHWRDDAMGTGRTLGQKVADYIWPIFLRPIT